jgi:thiamine-phosphate pyrophosphorylase
MIDRLQYISQANAAGSHIPAVERALLAGCKWIQLRIKDQSPAFIQGQALLAKALCDTFNARLIVNDHPEIALQVSAHGVHLGLLDMAIPEARKIVGPEMIIGGTANTLEHVLQRVAEGADYVGLGPLRFTTTKKNLSPILGLPGYRHIMNELQARQIDVPVIAIGGLVIKDVSELMNAGLYGVAVSGLITNTDDANGVVTRLVQALNTYTNPLNIKPC